MPLVVSPCRDSTRSTITRIGVADENDSQRPFGLFSPKQALHARCEELSEQVYRLGENRDEIHRELVLCRKELAEKTASLEQALVLCRDAQDQSSELGTRVVILESEVGRLTEAKVNLEADNSRLLATLRRRSLSMHGKSDSHTSHVSPGSGINNNDNCPTTPRKSGTGTPTRGTPGGVTPGSGRKKERALSPVSRAVIHHIEMNSEASMTRQRALEESAEKAKAAETAAINRANSLARTVHELENRLREFTQRAGSAESSLESSEAEKEKWSRKAKELEDEIKQARESATRASEKSQKSLEELKRQLSTCMTSGIGDLPEQLAVYQALVHKQAAALQAVREAYLSEKIRRQEAEKCARLEHIYNTDLSNRVSKTTPNAVGTQSIPEGGGGIRKQSSATTARRGTVRGEGPLFPAPDTQI